MTPHEYKSLMAKQKRKGRFPRGKPEERTYKGIVFDSKNEIPRFVELEYMAAAGEIFELRRQIEYPVAINGYHFCTFTPDFEYRTPDGRLVIEEIKSTGTAKDAAYRLRKKAFELTYGLRVTEIIR